MSYSSSHAFLHAHKSWGPHCFDRAHFIKALLFVFIAFTLPTMNKILTTSGVTIHALELAFSPILLVIFCESCIVKEPGLEGEKTLSYRSLVITRAFCKKGPPLFGNSGSIEIRDFEDADQILVHDEHVNRQYADLCDKTRQFAIHHLTDVSPWSYLTRAAAFWSMTCIYP